MRIRSTAWLVISTLHACAFAITSCERVSEQRTQHPRDSAAVALPAPPSTPTPAPAPALSHPDLRLASPLANQRVTSPLRVQGEARGKWYFEASFPVFVLDARGNRIAVAIATAQGEWMTPEFVPFEAVISFQTPDFAGWLLLEKSNASGLPEHADSVRVPIRF